MIELVLPTLAAKASLFATMSRHPDLVHEWWLTRVASHQRDAWKTQTAFFVRVLLLAKVRQLGVDVDFGATFVGDIRHEHAPPKSNLRRRESHSLDFLHQLDHSIRNGPHLIIDLAMALLRSRKLVRYCTIVN